jgi:hypothetical protein
MSDVFSQDETVHAETAETILLLGFMVVCVREYDAYRVMTKFEWRNIWESVRDVCHQFCLPIDRVG